ncbi:MAG: TonB-dependent receptor [Mediterranea sp.]|jgi:outer membrane cobalamin receptor|nr:TonB-dependent receptor [Mediterranea sp.]
MIYKLWIGLVALCSVNVFGQQPGDTITDNLHRLPEVSVQARRMPARMSVAAPVQAFGRSELQSLGLQNIGDAVRRFAGTNVRDYGGIGGLKTVSVRSLGAQHTAVAYDGVAVSNTQAGQIDIGRFALDEMEMLSLSVGQDNDLLQSARLFASAGVLSLYSRNPLTETERPVSFKAQIAGGSFGLFNPSLMWGQRIGRHTSYTVGGNYLQADGGYPFTLTNGGLVTHEKRRNTDIASWKAEGNLYHMLPDSSRLSLKLYYYRSQRGLPGSVILYNDQSNERLWDENFFAQAQYHKHFSPAWQIQAQGKYNYSWNRYENSDVQYEGGKQTDLNRQQEFYLSATVLWHPLRALTASWANDAVMNTLRNNFPNSVAPQRYTWLSALNLRGQIGRLTATATLLHTFMADEVRTGTRPANRSRFSPAVSLSYQPWAMHDFYLRLMYKETFRVPTFNDLYYQRVGNTALKPEKAHEWNVGATWSGVPFAFMNYLAVTLDTYYNKVDDKIVALPTTYVWRMMNFGKVDITGVDVTARTEVPVTRQVSLLVSGNYTYQRAIDVTTPGGKSYKHQVPYTPKHSGNASLLAETPWVNIGYTLTAVSERYMLPQNMAANRIDGYAEHTLSASRRFVLRHCHLFLQAELLNFTDEQYDVIKYYPMPGRSFRVTGSIRF